MATKVKIGNKTWLIDNERGTKKLLHEEDFDPVEYERRDDGWHAKDGRDGDLASS